MSAKYWCGRVADEDDFGQPIKDEFIDGRTRYGYWAIMVPVIWTHEGCGRLGMGCGQRYQRQADGQWLKVEG